MLRIAMYKFNIKYEIVFGLLALFSRGADTQCSAENQFGPNCDFDCHCINNEQCNRTTGDCPTGCDFDWAGPACQRKNLIPVGKVDIEMVARQSSNKIPSYYAKLAVDNDLSTCSYTNYANHSLDLPFWRVWLNKLHNIKKLVIRTSGEHLAYFEHFRVMVENGSNKNDGLLYDDQQLCYTHTDSVPLTSLMQVKCNKAIYGNQLRIVLATKEAQLVLCDVRIYGGCENGTYGISCTEKCSPHCDGSCDEDNGTCARCLNGLIGHYCTQKCEGGRWGENCERRCHTCVNQSCDSFTGSCYGHCKPGFKPTEFCDQECDDGWYGANCSEKCSKNCKEDTFCMKVDGSCLQCRPGFQGKHCENENQICLSEGGVAGIVVAVVILIAIGGFVGIFVTRKRMKHFGKQDSSGSAVVSFSNEVATENASADVGNYYENLKKQSGIEHTYS